MLRYLTWWSNSESKPTPGARSVGAAVQIISVRRRKTSYSLSRANKRDLSSLGREFGTKKKKKERGRKKAAPYTQSDRDRYTSRRRNGEEKARTTEQDEEKRGREILDDRILRTKAPKRVYATSSETSSVSKVAKKRKGSQEGTRKGKKSNAQR